MIDSDVRTIRVGSTDADIWVRITDKDGADISALTPQLRTISPAGVVADWFDPAPIEHPTADTIRARFELTPAVDDVGSWGIDALIDGEIVAVGGFLVVP
jgi:hypothetical protein